MLSFHIILLFPIIVLERKKESKAKLEEWACFSFTLTNGICVAEVVK